MSRALFLPFCWTLRQDTKSLVSSPPPTICRHASAWFEQSDAVLCLPGGCGTFEELFEAVVFKRLGGFLEPAVLVNTLGYYNRCIEFLNHSIAEHFMDQRHLEMWQVIEEPEEALTALAAAKTRSEDARQFSAVKAEG